MPKKSEPTPVDEAAAEVNDAQKRWLEAQQAEAAALADLKAAEDRLAKTEAEQPPS